MSRPEEDDIRARQAIHEGAALRTQGVRDIDWLLGEVERLRETATTQVEGIVNEVKIRPDDLRLVSDWGNQFCPVCQRPLLKHFLISQEVNSYYDKRQITLVAEVSCGAPADSS